VLRTATIAVTANAVLLAWAAAGQVPSSAVPAAPAREAALVVLERASRPFAAYAAVADRRLTLVAELSPASIQAGRWKTGAEVDVAASAADGRPLGTAHGVLEAGTYGVAIPLTLTSVSWPARVTVRLRSATEPATEDWVRVEPPPGQLAGDAIAYRAGSRIAPRPVAAFVFARNERIRIEWPVLAALDRRGVRLLDKAGRPLPVQLPLDADPASGAAIVEMSLSGLGQGDYLIEFTAAAAPVTESHLIAIRIR
jgi:hypothetical protein